MAHIILIDPIEKLVIKKDSTLLLAHSLKELGTEVYFLFSKDFGFTSNLDFQKMGKKTHSYTVWDFSTTLQRDGIHLDRVSLKQAKKIELGSKDTLHMRLDPPFDLRYLRTCWILRALELEGVRVINSPKGILLNNEKLRAFQEVEGIPSYVGESREDLSSFVQGLTERGHKEFIFKPLDLYQGIGVQKVVFEGLEQFQEIFLKLIDEYRGPVVVQPFQKIITEGEVRATYFLGRPLAHILKTPQEGHFLANVAQGANYKSYNLTPEQESICERVAKNLLNDGVLWVAFDLIGPSLSEVNVTCPGLLVETSTAHGENLALKIVKEITNKD